MATTWYGSTPGDYVIDSTGKPRGGAPVPVYTDSGLTTPATGLVSETGVAVGGTPVSSSGGFLRFGDPAGGTGTLFCARGDGSFLELRADPQSVFLSPTQFDKADWSSVAFNATGAGTATVKAGTRVTVSGVLVVFAADTIITVPALTAGTDYEIYAVVGGTASAVTAGSAAPANSRLIGGFHYAPGGNAPAQAGGDSTPAINPYSLWDLKWRPAARSARGMTLVAGSFWADIYLANTNPDANGTSRFGQQIADGGSLPLVPAMFGGNGVATYPTGDWWSCSELLASAGKRLPTYAEFAALAYGITEQASLGVDAVTTGLDAPRTSKWGVMQAAGVMWSWSAEFGGPYASAAWAAITNGRGQVYNQPNGALFGGAWNNGGFAGSRCSYWDYGPSGSGGDVGARGVCDHLTLA